MSIPFGLDLGNNSSVLAIAQNKGIDIVVNEVSNRSTPSVVGFGPKSRFVGEAGKSKQLSNVKNTVDNFKRIIGLSYSDSEFQEEESKYFSSTLVPLADHKIGAEVELGGKKHVFTATQLAAMFIDKVKQTVEVETKATVKDVCIAVPTWFTEEQRYNVADAARIAGLNPVNIVNDITAAGVAYGVFKPDLPEPNEKPRIVAFVDIGHSTYTTSIAAIHNGHLKVLGIAYDKHFGGRNIDRALAEHFADEFKSKYKIDIRSNPKAYNRVLTACEKLKKVLSVNSEAPINIESLMDDIDVSSQLKREQLEELIEPMLKRTSIPIKEVLEQSGISTEEIDFVEIIGGCTRVPAIKDSISKTFGKPLSSTINQDEAIAKGAAFICAAYSPTVRVRSFKLEGIEPFSVSFSWDRQFPDENTQMDVFSQGTSYPAAKSLKLKRNGDFTLEAKYSNRDQLPRNANTYIGSWDIKGIKLPEDQDFEEVKVKIRANTSGFHIVEKAYVFGTKIVKEEVKKDKKGKSIIQEFKKPFKKYNLQVIPHTFALSESELNKYIEIENELLAQDKLIDDTEHSKNALEEYIYSLRSKLDSRYSQIVSSDERTMLSDLLEKTENWLYEEGEDTTKSEYEKRHKKLLKYGNELEQKLRGAGEDGDDINMED